MNKLYRYELKFILDEGAYAQALSWMYAHTGARVMHDPRTVNSVYFDDPAFSAVRDNLAGLSERRKIRLRWYHGDDREDVNGAALEIKHRKERVGKKERYDLQDLESNIIELEYGSLFGAIHDHLGGNHKLPIDDHFTATLHVSYRRYYFEGMNGVRVTFDRPIVFYSTYPHAKPFQTTACPYTPTIMEIKFSPGQKDNVAQSLRLLALTPKRHSKYLAGLSAFGYAVY